MNKIFSIAKWEFLEKVKTKTFIISLIVTPLIIISFSIVPTLLSKNQEERTKPIGVVDKSGLFFLEIKEQLEKFRLDDGQPNFVLINLTEKNTSSSKLKKNADNDILRGVLDAYIFIDFFNYDSLKVELRSQSIGNFRDAGRIEEAINRIITKNKLIENGYSEEVLNFIEEHVNIDQIKVEKGGKEGKQDFLAVFFSSFIFILLLMMMVIYSGQMLVRSLIEEKSNKLIEVLVSSCSPDELLAGKILGLSTLGLTQIFIWAIIGIGLVGSSLVSADIFNNVALMLVYFILGFIFFTTLFVGIGSIVTTEQEAQMITTYLSIVLMLPVVIAVPAIQNPDSTLLKIFSFIPLTIPSVMLMRVNISDVSGFDIWLTILILLLSIIIMIKLSAKIFRVGILSYGSKPTLKEIIQWLRSDN